MRATIRKYPILRKTMVGQKDFDLYGLTLDAAARTIISRWPPKAIRDVQTEIVRFLVLDLKANDLDAELDRLSYGDHSREPRMGARDYLAWLDGLLAEAGGRSA
jgi:hypothetical protein